jgi:hypothetical protein
VSLIWFDDRDRFEDVDDAREFWCGVLTGAVIVVAMGLTGLLLVWGRS